MEKQVTMQIAIIGAGPAGLFAAEALANKGYGVALFNRDIKPGGLAEYGIFPDKHKLKDGLRAQFKNILSSERIEYYGNIRLGVNECIQLSTLFTWGFQAVLVTCGAQGIKSLHLPGENMEGVIHAKDLVYYYNSLPPFASRTYKIGKRIAIVGAGNVMADIAHYLLNYTNVEKIFVVIRRGPGEVKFDKKEMEPIIAYLETDGFEKEMARVSDEMIKVGQDPVEAKLNILAALPKAHPVTREAALFFNFLSSPKQVIGENRVEALEIEQNELALQEGEVIAKGTGKFCRIPVDNVIFAIGDRVQEELGLPVNRNELFISKNPTYPIEGESFELEDPSTGQNLTGVFVGGWSRKPSSGLVGTARKDGVNAAKAVDLFLVNKSSHQGIERVDLENKLKNLGCKVVKKDLLPILEQAEKLKAEKKNLEEYKFLTNEEMLTVIGVK